MKVRLYPKLIMGIFALELALCIFDAKGAFECRAHSECWTWFLTLALNIPASALVGIISESVVGDSTSTSGILITALLFLVIGTLWWSLLVHAVAYSLAALRRFFVHKPEA